MAQPRADTVKVVDESHVAPPPGSVSTTTVPLTFLDVLWLFCGPMQRIFFYEFPYLTLHFTQTIFPHLKHSLSLALRHFFPLAAKLTCPFPPQKPYILYNEGDSVPFILAESGADFNHLIANHARDQRAFKSLFPQLPTPRVSCDTAPRVVPVMAVQVTVFPNSGFSIGITFNHVAADGRSFNHFMKSWASIYRSGEAALTSLPLPFINKEVIKEPDELSSIYLKDLLIWEDSFPETESTVPQDNVLLTLVLSRTRIEKLKRWVQVTNQSKSDNELGSLRISTYAVTCAFMWVSLMKLQETETNGHLDDDNLYHFVSVADCRERFEFPVPATYFGNCLAWFFVSIKRGELMGKNGIAVAAVAIAKTIRGLQKGPLVGAENWLAKAREIVRVGRIVTVAGSPRLRVYDTDFGWGRPKKSEVAHIGPYGAFSLHESRDDEGGVEIGFILGRSKLDFYAKCFEHGLHIG